MRGGQGNNPDKKKEKKNSPPMKKHGEGGCDVAAVTPVAITPAPSSSTSPDSPPPISTPQGVAHGGGVWSIIIPA
jgi:hypothetical protein